MSEKKEFQRTMREAEQRIKDHLDFLNKKEANSQIYSSCGALENSIEKLIEVCPAAATQAKEHVDNIFYHIGKIKGCL